jgi:hypothetical protein
MCGQEAGWGSGRVQKVNNADALLLSSLASNSQPLHVQTRLTPQHPRTWSCSGGVRTAASAAAATGWPSRDPASSSGHDPELEPPRAHPLVAAVAAVLLAVRDAASSAAAGTRGAGRRLARLQVWLGKPEALLFREGCQLLACLMFILLYVWRYVVGAALPAVGASGLQGGAHRAAELWCRQIQPPRTVVPTKWWSC